MAQFDYPRINFHGAASTNVGTANNNDFMASMGPAGQVNPGLMLNDIVEVHAFLPPRLYVSPITEGLLSSQYTFNKVMVGNYPIYFVEIDTVTAENYYEWAKEPLGTSSIDQSFLTLYNTAAKRYDGNWNQLKPDKYTTVFSQSLTPAEWNFNGGMEMTIKSASVSGIVAPPVNGQQQLFTPANPGSCPEALKPYLSTTFSNCNMFDPQNPKVLGSVCDLNPSAPYSTQFFNDSFFLYDSGFNTVMQGSPSKGMTRWINFNRVVNLAPSPMIASGAVFHAIPKEDMAAGWSALEAAFVAGGADTSRTIQGAFIRYSIYEVYEARDPDYDTGLKPTPGDGYPKNPALLTITGSITPWYDGDMKSAPMGRLLNPSPGNPFDSTPLNAFIEAVGKPNQVAPATFKIDEANSVLSLDMVNSLQENRLEPAPFPAPPSTKISTDPSLKLSYELTQVGQWDIRLGTDKTSAIVASVTIDKQHFTIEDFIENGGMMDLNYEYTVKPGSPPLDATPLSIWGQNSKNTYASLMQESEIYLASDENCTYFDQRANGSVGLNQGTSLRPVTVRLFQYGVPVPQQSPVSMNMFAYNLNPIISLEYDQAASKLGIDLYDGAPIQGFVTDNPMIYVNVFTEASAQPDPGSFSGATEFYINSRVLRNPVAEYAQYYNEDGSPNPATLTFQALYDEVFQSYYLMFPGMTQQQSLYHSNEANWKQPWLAGALRERVSLSNWMKTSYMPRSRTISSAQRKLIQDWVTLQIGS